MFNRISVVFAVMNISVFTILSCAFSILSFKPLSDVTGFVLVCAIASFMYPCLLALTGSKIGYWRGALSFLLVMLAAQIVGFAAYALKTHAIQHGDSESGYLFGVYLAASAAIAVVFYTPGHWVSSWLIRRPKNSL
jgi:hypothetical protein